MKLPRRSTLRTLAALATVAVAAAGLSGCASGGQSSDTSSPIEFWGWAPGYKEAAALWNKTHDQKVKFQTIASGSAGGYTKMQAAVKAGNGPCLAQVGNESIPSFVLDGMLVDISKESAKYDSGYSDSVRSAMKVGGGAYGIPVDTAPMGMFYRTDVYKKFGITPAATWDEFVKQAAQVHAADPNTYLSSYDPSSASAWGSFAQQAGGTFFSTEGDAWKVTVDSPATRQVATVWQQQLDAKTTKVEQSDTPDWYQEVQNGTIATAFEPVWWAGILEGSAADSAGKWAVAPLPNHSADQKSTGTSGGSATSVLKGCSNVQGAVDFANWMSTDTDAMSILIDKAALFPASTAGQQNPALQKGVDFFGGQKIFQEFTAYAKTIDPHWQYGPLNTETNSAIKDAFTGATTGTGTLTDGLAAAQKAVVAVVKAKGLSTK
ncbi:extracellular solute-binding protein [Leifsonia shinshuensis]|uniref:ABC transporter substrate-binding protein n=1 Tax=Leifsonia shinshuensis TaxID=150026 RepID=UPI001F5153D2|nr:extracellular solute-binding protein [Leifsonia shinshuensis]MCI0158352.1 extracellular solute-binding protein [Leifsonia shinshuensis]